MKKIDVINSIGINDLPEHFSIVAETCGIETARLLIKELGGLTVSIPKKTSLRKLIERLIHENYDEYSIQNIARELGMSDRAIGNKMRKIKKY